MKAKPNHSQVSKPTNENPWLHKGALNAVLDLELCQEMQFFALRQASRDQNAEQAPETISMIELRQLAIWYGPQVYIDGGSHLRQLFGGVTLAVYQAIEALYCSRLLRSSNMVWHILQQMARKVGSPGISYETVWIICEHLAGKRRKLTEVSCTFDRGPWWVIALQPDVWVQDPPGTAYQPAVVCVGQAEPERVLGFWIGPPQQASEGSLLALYEALVSLREPAQDGGGGLRWKLPARLLSSLPLNNRYQQACASLSLEINILGVSGSPLVGALRSRWERDLTHRMLTHHQLSTLFDTYLAKHLGYGPLRIRRENDHRFQWHIGYNREPSWQFPALRSLLPHVPARIAADGRIPHEGLHYVDELLSYWPEQDVTLCLAPEMEALAWVYLNGDILCQAGAQELHRRDGSFRPNRPGR